VSHMELPSPTGSETHEIAMYCYVHPDREAVGACSRCGRAVCSDCAVAVGANTVCRHCLTIQPLPSAKNPDTAFILELVPGLFGILGIGYLYAGRTNDGIIRLVVWLAYLAVAATIIIGLSAALVGFLCIPVHLIIQVGVPIWSAFSLKKKMVPQV